MFCFIEKNNFEILNEEKEFDLLIKYIKNNSSDFSSTVKKIIKIGN